MISHSEMAVRFGAELEAREIHYALTGSVAASLYGEPRSTVDIDFTVQASAVAIERLAELRHDFYVPEEALSEAAASFDSFNLVHHASGIKVDVFVLDDSPFNQLMMERRTLINLGSGQIWVASPEDVTARKIRWYDLTNRTSERQLRDISTLVSYGNVDVEAVVATAELVGLGDLAQELVDNASSGER